MSATGLDVFDKALQTTNTWLGEITDNLGLDRQIAWHALGAVLRTLRELNSHDAARSVFRVLNRHLPEGQIDKVRDTRPDEIRAMWPEREVAVLVRS